MRLLVILNEHKPKAHIDVYNALDRLVIKGKITKYKIYPFKFRLLSGAKNHEVANEIEEIIRNYEPELVLFSHAGKLKINKESLSRFRKIHTKTIFAYRDGDIYHPFYKPMPKEIFKLISICNVSFWCGYDYYVRKAEHYCRDNRYVPSITDTTRFAATNIEGKEYDIVMIGNLIKSKIPFKTFPGSIERLKIADYFYEKLGNKFAVYGNGWGNRKYCIGAIDFEQQGRIYKKARISLGNNNLHSCYYFSNRLPIALGSGTLMVHNYEDGIEAPFKNIKYKFFYKGIKQAFKITRYLLDKSQDEIDRMALVYSEYAKDKFTMEYSLEYIIDVMKSYYHSNDRTRIPSNIQNPWLDGITLMPYRRKESEDWHSWPSSDRFFEEFS